ncbi:MAG: aldehyde dehydrogenase family protein [Phycisphaerales bacterium]|nr:aldehyde dehydrogenase family protein [Phycisphaerales bacterium]
MTTADPINQATALLERLDVFHHPLVIPPSDLEDEDLVSTNPANGEPLGGVRPMDVAAYKAAVGRAHEAFLQWRILPPPIRGEIVRRIGEALRKHKADLGAVVTTEVGKIRSEGDGEIQECIDIADFAVGLSRQLYGLTIASERANHRMMEQWHPLGAIGVITAFNFPAAVWAWNALVAAVCGDAVVWKPSLMAPLTAVSVTNVVHEVMRTQDLWKPTGQVRAEDLFTLVIGRDEELGEAMTADARLPLISATGSCRMGRHVSQRVAARLGRCLLELGGNNALILMPDADMDLAVRAIVFGAVGTAGQRCTSTRRLLCVGGDSMGRGGRTIERVLPQLANAYRSIKIGNPMNPDVLMGPLISTDAVLAMKQAIDRAVEEGCEVVSGGLDGIERGWTEPGNYVEPTIIRVPKGATPAIAMEETFAPILYVFDMDSLDEAMSAHNAVAQGLSSAIFTDSVRAAERFLSPAGSDCGIANVNLGTSGAEIGGAFGGEKDTGGGRESGSDAWKSYMRRQTCTVNYGRDLPLAQGVRFS